MNFSFGNTILAKDMDSVDFKNLKPTDQIMIFNDSYFSEINSHLSEFKIMIINSINFNIIYNMNSVNITPRISCKDSEKNDEEIDEMYERNDINEIVNEIVDEAYLDNKEEEITYIYYKDKKYKLNDGRNYKYSTGNVNEFEKYESFRLEFLKEIHDKFIGATYYRRYEQNMSFVNSKNEKCYSITIPINNDISIIFTIIFNVNKDTKTWTYATKIILLKMDGTFLSLNENFENLYNFFKDINLKSNSFNEKEYKDFDFFIKVMKYDIRDSVKDNKMFLYNVANTLSNDIVHSIDIYDMYKPVYVDKELKVEIYPFNVHGQNSVIVYLNGEFKDSYDVTRLENKKEIEIASKIGLAINNFNRSDNGLRVNPIDGKIYGNDNNARVRYLTVYEDESSKWFKNYASAGYEAFYYKLQNYWILCDNYKDKDIIEEIRERKNVMDALSANNK